MWRNGVGWLDFYIPKTEFRAIEHFFMNADKMDDGISGFLRAMSSRFKGLKTVANPVFLVNQAFTNFGILPLVTKQRFLSTTPQTNAITEMGKTLAGVKPDALDMLAIKKGIDRSSSWTPNRGSVFMTLLNLLSAPSRPYPPNLLLSRVYFLTW